MQKKLLFCLTGLFFICPSFLFAQEKELSVQKLTSLVGDYQAKIKKLTQDIVTLKDKEAKISEDKDKYYKEVIILREVNLHNQAKAVAFEQLNTELAQLKQKLELQNQELGNSLNTLKNEFSVLEKEHVKLKGEQGQRLVSCESDISSFKDERIRVQAEADKLVKEKQTLSEDNNRIKDELAKISSQVGLVSQAKDNQFKQYQEEITALKKSLEEKEAAYAVIQKTHQDTLEERFSAGKKNEDKISQLEQALGAKDNELRQYQDESGKLRQSYEDKKIQLSLIEQAHTQSVQSKVALEKQNQDLNATFNQAVKLKDNQIKQYQEELHQLKAENKKNQDESAQLKEQNKWLKDRYISDRQAGESQRAIDSVAKKEKDLVIREAEKVKKELAQAKIERDVLFRQNEENLQKLREAIIKSGNEERLSSQHREAKQELVDVKVDTQKLKETNQQQIDELKAYKRQIKIMTNDLEEIKSKVKRLMHENKILKIRATDKNVTNRSQLIALNKKLLKENAVLHYNQGVFYTQTQNYEKAIEEFLKDIKINPNDAEAHYNLAVIYGEYLEQADKAVAHFKRYITLSPNDRDADRARKYMLTYEVMSPKK